MFEDIKSFFWFLIRGPKFYSTLLVQIYTKLRKNQDTDLHIKIATSWCEENLTSVDQCLKDLGVPENNLQIENAFDESYKSKINQLIDNSQSNFGGPGHVDLIYTICERLNIKNAIETGVAYGWSSAAIFKIFVTKRWKLNLYRYANAKAIRLSPYWSCC